MGGEGLKDVIVGERDVGYLDPGIAGVLEALNSLEKVETTSSCIGRITMVEGPVHWARDPESRIVFKTHGTITPHDILRVVGRGYRNLWLKATGPILHLATPSIECATHILSLARGYGFKHSGILSAKPGRIVVELLSASQLAAPLVLEGTVLISLSEESLSSLARVANEAVEWGRRGLEGLVSALTSAPGPCSHRGEVGG